MESRIIYKALALAVLFEMAVFEAMDEDKANKVCSKEVGINETYLTNMGSVSDEEKILTLLNKFNTCFYKKTEAVDDSGNFDVDRIMDLFEAILDDAKNVINKCTKHAGSIKDLDEKISTFDTCIFENHKNATSNL